nr:hypothetical protein GCM10020063_027380 [Dactylosporangium thailandense]
MPAQTRASRGSGPATGTGPAKPLSSETPAAPTKPNYTPQRPNTTACPATRTRPPAETPTHRNIRTAKRAGRRLTVPGTANGAERGPNGAERRLTVPSDG